MDKQTQIGIGATAVFALAGIAAPTFGWPVGGSIMAVCVIVAAWGFWPVMSVPRLHWRLPLQDAAQRAYETAEREGWLDRMVAPTIDPQDRLNVFKIMFLMDSHAHFRGVCPPSTKARTIPRNVIGHDNQGQWHLDLNPIAGESRLNHVQPYDKIAFEDVTVSKRDLYRLLSRWRTIYQGQN